MYQFILFLCILCTSSAITLRKEGENKTSTESLAALVQEVSQPSMTVQNASPQDHLLPAFYTFNKGEPFLVEKDPLTGAIDFDKKTTPTVPEKVESNTSSGVTEEKDSSSDDENDYFYDDQEFAEDNIDRKDGNVGGPNIYRPNEIFQNPYKISPDLHQFLNLPVHYSSSDKFPLISSSYANTKVQGTGSSSVYSNHKYATSSTQSPSYYTMPTTQYSTQKPQYQSTTVRTTTSSSTTKATTTTEAEEEYENTDYNEYEGEELGLQDNQAVPSQQHTFKPETTKYTVTTFRPTVFQFTTTLTNKQNTTSVQPVTENQKEQVSIVTSLPLDMYYSSSQDPTVNFTSATFVSQSTPLPNKSAELPTLTHPSKDLVTTRTTIESQQYTQGTTFKPLSETFYSGFGEEPFRPIFGPSDPPNKHDDTNHLENKNEFLKPKPGINEFQKLPPHHNIPYIQNSPSLTLPPKLEPPRLNSPQSYFTDQPVKLVPGQHSVISFGDSSKINTISRPIQDHTHERPSQVTSFNKEYNSPIEYKPYETLPSQSRPGTNPVYEGRPLERPVPSVKPRPAVEMPLTSNFKMPSKVESHFIKVSSDQENPSYSLQTSFSIGVPASSSDDKDPIDNKPVQGVGQVFFPDNTPAESIPLDTNANTDLPSQVLRPPNSRVPIHSYQLNRPGYRQPALSQGYSSQIPPKTPNDDLQPPAGENYPRPHWENHNKPYNNPIQNIIPKKDIILPQYYPGLNRGKPENIQRPDLPNILPQFRPNAKIGQVETHQPFVSSGERIREPFDTLQPPPLPQPQHLRINRNDDDTEIERELISSEIKVDPFIHRRSGPQLTRVTTLQMMQHNPQRKSSMAPDASLENRQSSEKDKPVFLVYPSTHGVSNKPHPEEAVVIGTRAQRPIPPANLEKEDLDSFPLDDNKHFPIPGRDRVDTPILKTKLTAKPMVKNEFPYHIEKPFRNNIPEERILATGSITKEYTAFSPTPASSTEESNDHDSEINIIPYLQDYMPFATKKPQVFIKPTNNIKKDNKIISHNSQTNQVISTTLNASLATTAKTTTEKVQQISKPEEKNESEMTLSATMYTQQRPANHKVPVTYTPSEPQPLGFQAPFMASLSAPESQGWSVVTDKNLKPLPEIQEESTDTSGEDTKFDIENFKPQLFGGFQPILPSSKEDSEGSAGSINKEKDILLAKGDREEKAL